MNARSSVRSAVRWLAAGVGLAAGAYATYVGVAWYRYGRMSRSARPDEQDELLDRFMPVYDVAGRHHIRVAAPATITLAARDMDP